MKSVLKATSGLLETARDVNRFMFAGNATVTLESLKTGDRFTFRVEASGDGKRHYVSVLTGADNESSYSYLGTWHGPDYRHGKKSRIGADAPSARAFEFLARRLRAGVLHERLRVWHEGRCGACNRKLTVPSSVKMGIGPDCAERLGITCVEV